MLAPVPIAAALAVALLSSLLGGPVPAAPASAPVKGVPDRAPIVSPAAGNPKGTVILIHGGAWAAHGRPHALRQHARHAARLNALGFRTMAVTYRAGVRSLADVVAFYDGVRRRRGPGETICALGDSAGGHLALMLAARRPDLDCAISRGAPTDLRIAHGIWRPSVGRLIAPYVPLEEFSPVTYADRLAGRTLASHALADPIVDHDQLVHLRRASAGGIRAVTLPPGRAGYAHAHVDVRALRRLERAEARMLDAAAGR